MCGLECPRGQDRRRRRAPPQSDINFAPAIPIFRIFSVEKAKEFYLGYLGFQLDWEHRFTDTAPLYAQISRSGLIVHLSEHHGDASPDSTAYVTMHGVDAFWAELAARGYPYLKPGIETVDWGRVLTVIDPFSNQLRFCDPPGSRRHDAVAE